MKEEETSETVAPARKGFRILDQPLVGEGHDGSRRNGGSPMQGASADLLYMVARDPTSLFLYWDLNWTRLFARAGISVRQVHLRTYRGDGTVEGTQEINPFRDHCYADVGTPGMEYYCELGSFKGAEWKGLIRSGTVATPEASMSGDFSAEFAALPIHLSFQRLLDVLATTHDINRATLARSVGELQESARLSRGNTAPGDWPKLAREIAGRLNGASSCGTNEDTAAELAELVEMALGCEKPVTLTEEEIAQWKELGKRYGGSSWFGASHGSFGGSSPT